MNTHSDKTTETKSNAVANGMAVQQGAEHETFQLEDNRPETIAQRKIQEAANNSPQADQFKAVQSMANNSNQVKQLRTVQAMADTNTTQLKEITEEAQPVQKKENTTGLPDNLKSGVENLSGHSLDDVKVHYNSDKPAQLNALAYAQGTDIHVAGGQERHLPHEAWHVVQQKQGRVKPTMQLKENMVNDDKALENEADTMGTKAVTQQVSATAGNLKLNTSVTGSNNTTHPIQRLIGFEVEYQVPSFGRFALTPTLKGGKKEGEGLAAVEKPANKNVLTFLFGGHAYGTKLGGSADPGANCFRITTDHNSAVSRDPVRAKLAAMGKIDPVDAMDGDHHSNIEYVTSPVDELATGSDKILGKLIDDVTIHAKDTFTKAKADNMGLLIAPATNLATGTPVNDIKAWLSDGDYQTVKPQIDTFKDTIVDSCYLQATVGILPSGVYTLFARASGDESIQEKGGSLTHIFGAIDTAYLAIAQGVATHKYITTLRAKNTAFDSQIVSSVGGMIKLLVMYRIGEVLSQTSAFPGGSIKNAVPFLLKIDPAQIVSTGPYGMLFDDVTDDFITVLAGLMDGRAELTVDYWKGLGYVDRARKDDDFVTEGTNAELAALFLQGKKPSPGNAQTGGSSIKNPDNLPKLEKRTFDQKGIPLEYRYLKARPTASDLKTELLKIVAESRAVNLNDVPDEEKETIMNDVKK